MTDTFTQLNLHPQLVQTVTDLGYTAPTPIQSAVIPTMLTGQDIIGQAQTGTGKTAAFSLPIIQTLELDKKHVQCLVMAPTRELAIQVADAMAAYGRHGGVRVLSVYGGSSYTRQITRLKKGVDIVVGTPGRLLDLIKRRVLDLGRVSTVVLDEADEMLSMGFIEDIETILSNTPDARQTALFSATLPKAIRHLSSKYMKNPKSFAIGCKQLTLASVAQRYYVINESDKVAALSRLFEGDEITRALVFVRTRVGTGELVNELSLRGYSAEALNGDLNQDAREKVLTRFRNHQVKVLVATDVAARGLDIDDISHVINYDLPQDPEVYVHRIGRTGRAGKTGVAVTLVTPNEKWRIKRIESYTKQNMTESKLPSATDIQSYRDAQLVENVMVWLRRGRCNREKEIVTELMTQGHDPIQIAATALKLARDKDKKFAIEAISEIKEQPKRTPLRAEYRNKRRNSNNRPSNSHEQGMVRLTLGTGKLHDLKINQIVGSLARHTDIPGNCLGKVCIQKNNTLVDVPKEFLSQVMAKIDNYRIGRHRITVEQA